MQISKKGHAKHMEQLCCVGFGQIFPIAFLYSSSGVEAIKIEA